MTNLLTLYSDTALMQMKIEVRKEATVSFDKIAHFEKDLGLVEKHNRFMDLLVIFDKFCRAHGVKYSLADGTLLGAYRHNQFIPWDDDADVMMTRREYKKYIEVLKEESELRDFKLLFCHRASTKQLIKDGILIDVFLIDDIPSCRIEWEIRKACSRLLRVSCLNRRSIENVRKQSRIKRTVMSILFPIVWLFGRIERIIIGKRIFDINDKLAEVTSDSGFCTKYTSNWRELNRVFKKEWFSGYCDIEMAGYKFMCINGAEEYLVNMFGDWKKIPADIRREHDHIGDLLDDKFINGWK